MSDEMDEVARSHIGPPPTPKSRKVWVVTLQYGEVADPGTEVMIEQFGDDPPSIAFRADRYAVWGPPHKGEVR